MLLTSWIRNWKGRSISHVSRRMKRPASNSLRESGWVELLEDRIVPAQVIIDPVALTITGDDSNPNTFYGKSFTTLNDNGTTQFHVSDAFTELMGNQYSVSNGAAAKFTFAKVVIPNTDNDTQITATEVTGTVAGNNLEFTAGNLSIELGGGLFNYTGTSVLFDPTPAGSAAVFNITTGTAQLPALVDDTGTPSVSFRNLSFSASGQWNLDNVTVSVPNGYSKTIPLTNDFSAEIQSITPPTAADLNKSQIRVPEAEVSLTGFPSDQLISAKLQNPTIGSGGKLQLANSVLSMSLPTESFDEAMDWIPFQVDRFDVEFGANFPNSSSDFRILVSGGLEASSLGAGDAAITTFPITARVEDLAVNINKLRRGEFPFDSGVAVFGIEDLNLGGLQVSGQLVFGAIPLPNSNDTAIFGQIAGSAEASMGSFSIDLALSEYGPIVAALSAPAKIPLGPTGLILDQVSGGIRFGQTIPDVDDPQELNSEDFEGVPDGALSVEDITTALLEADAAGRYLWEQPFSVHVGAQIFDIATSMFDFNGSLLFNSATDGSAGQKIVAHGDVSFMGLSFAQARTMMSFTDPLSPSISAAFIAPSPGNPLGFLLPFNAELGLQLRTDGLVLGTIAGARSFMESPSDSLLQNLAARLQRDHRRALAQWVLDTNNNGAVTIQENAAVITANMIRTRIGQLLPSAIGSLVSGNQLQATATTAARVSQSVLQEILVSIEEIASDPDQAASLYSDVVRSFQTGLSHAISSAAAVMNPSLTIEGEFQPVLFGIPFGEPDAELRLSLDKTGLFFETDFSVIKMASRMALPISFPVPISDSLSAAVSLPFGPLGTQLIDVLNGRLPDLTPTLSAATNWSVFLQGGVDVFDMSLAQLSGLVFPANWSSLNDRVFRSDTETQRQPGEAFVVSQESLYRNLNTYGGILLSGQLNAPRFITNPIEVISQLGSDGAPPSKPSDFPAWAQRVMSAVTTTDPVANVTWFTPSFASALQTNFGGYNSETETNTPGNVPRIKRTGSAATFQQIVGAAFLEGDWNGKLLGLDIGDAHLTASASGLTINGSIPALGIETDFTINSRDVPGLPGGFPTIGARATLDTNALGRVFSKLGLPASWLPSANATFQAYTPGFDPNGNALQKNGGISLSTSLSVPGLFDSIGFDFALTPSSDGTHIPNFVATASVQDLKLGGNTGGLRFSGQIQLRKSKNEIALMFNNCSGTFLGQSVTFSGSMGIDNGQLRGTLTLQVAPSFSLGNFPVSQAQARLAVNGSYVGLELSGLLDLSLISKGRNPLNGVAQHTLRQELAHGSKRRLVVPSIVPRNSKSASMDPPRENCWERLSMLM